MPRSCRFGACWDFTRLATCRWATSGHWYRAFCCGRPRGHDRRSLPHRAQRTSSRDGCVSDRGRNVAPPRAEPETRSPYRPEEVTMTSTMIRQALADPLHTRDSLIEGFVHSVHPLPSRGSSFFVHPASCVPWRASIACTPRRWTPSPSRRRCRTWTSNRSSHSSTTRDRRSWRVERSQVGWCPVLVPVEHHR